jgi:DNA-binding transcriptional MocR family regulator
MSLTSLFAQRTLGMGASEIREILKLLEQPDLISFAGGIPDPAYFPREAFARAMEKALSPQMAPTSLQYAPSEGYTPLREWIAGHMKSIGIQCDIENILITAGSQQALDYLGKLYLNAGDTALVNWPTYLGALSAFKAYEPRFDRLATGGNQTVEVHATTHLEAAKEAGGRVKFAYLSPDFANPTGITLDEAERREVLAQAQAMDCMIIEDAAYQTLRYEGDAIAPILALEQQDGHAMDECRTIYCGSFSKTLSPGLRVGWVVAARPVISQMVLLKQAGDLQTATINQIAVHAVAEACFETHIATLNEVYGARMTSMLAALEAHMPKDVEWTRPAGGMFIWLTLPKSCDARALLQAALKVHVAFVPGGAFYADGSMNNTLRLNFSMADDAHINEGIARLGKVISEQLSKAD